MTVLTRISAAVAAVILTTAIASAPALAKVKGTNKQINNGGSAGCSGGTTSTGVNADVAKPKGTPATAGCANQVPGPILGAGLPFFAAGYGVYWLVRRRRQSA